MKRTWLFIALLNFLIAALFGALLRFAFVVEIPWIKYQYLLHAHSHVAMLGWIYLALFALLIHAFLPESEEKMSKYNWLFWATEMSVLGMLFSFPVQGYGPVSIAFSTLHILFSYLFVWWFWQDLRGKHSFSAKLVKTALVFMVFSTLGIWLMGPIMATPLRHSSFYYMAVQFYLHFQFNGWFLIAVLALFFKLSEDQDITFPIRKLRSFWWLLIISCVLTYALAVVWSTKVMWVLAANSIGVILQLLALIIFLQMIWPVRRQHQLLFQGWDRTLLGIAFVTFSLKMIVQAFIVIPFVAEAAYTVRNYIIGFIHLILLGAVTFFLLSYAFRENLMARNKQIAFTGLVAITAGFILSEGLLFLQGTMLWGALGFLPYYYEGLFGVSALIPLGILGLFFGNIPSPKGSKGLSPEI